METRIERLEMDEVVEWAKEFFPKESFYLQYAIEYICDMYDLSLDWPADKPWDSKYESYKEQLKHDLYIRLCNVFGVNGGNKEVTEDFQKYVKNRLNSEHGRKAFQEEAEGRGLKVVRASSLANVLAKTTSLSLEASAQRIESLVEKGLIPAIFDAEDEERIAKRARDLIDQSIWLEPGVLSAVQNFRDTIAKLNEPEEVSEYDLVQEELRETYIRKNTDYGNSFDQSLDKHGLIAAIVRMEDKLGRLTNLIKDDERMVTDESTLDTVKDLANYAIMTAAWMQKKEQ